MKPGELLEYWRSQISDTDTPYLWSDDEAFIYMNAAQEMFARLTGGFPDASTADVVEVDALANTPFSATHESILKIKTARLADGTPVDVLNYENLVGERVKLNDVTGVITGMVVGMEDNKVRWTPVPSEATTVYLTVDRMPITTVKEGVPFEVPARHHIYLAHWMSYLAYSKPDSEGEDQKAAQREETKFRAYCEQARLEKERRKHHTRVVRYGGI